MIIVIGGIKGGTGKTTLATNLAVLNVHLKRKTLLVDADDQGSASDWADQRESYHGKSDRKFHASFPTISLLGKNLYQQILKIKDDYEDIFIDTGGRDTVSQRSALTIADCYVIPFKPRSVDIWTVGKVLDIVQEIKTINPDLKVIVCINQADPKGIDNEEALKILEEIPDFKCATTFLGYRKSFANAASMGLGIWELDKDLKAKDELLAIYSIIHQ